MKKIFLCLIAVFALVSCQDDVKFNDPSFEGQKNYGFWRAVDSKAFLAADGSLRIEAYTRNEKVTLKTTSTAVQTYPLGTSTSKTAAYVYTDTNGTTTFTTGVGSGQGEIVITKYDAVNRTISGTFKFNAENIDDSALAEPFLNFQFGVFFNIPVIAN